MKLDAKAWYQRFGETLISDADSLSIGDVKSSFGEIIYYIARQNQLTDAQINTYYFKTKAETICRNPNSKNDSALERRDRICHFFRSVRQWILHKILKSRRNIA